MRPTSTRSSAGQLGFTLLEMLVAVTILVMLLGVTVQVLIKARTLKARSELRMEFTATARAVDQVLRRDLAGCYLYRTAAEAFDLDDSTPGRHKLALVTATPNPGESEVATVIYYLDGTTLRRAVDAYGFNSPVTFHEADGDFDLVVGVTSLEFYPDPVAGWPRTVRYVMRLTDERTGRTVSFTRTIALQVED